MSNTLFCLIPEEYRKPSIKKMITEALKAGYTEAYIRSSIEYIADTCTGSSFTRWKGSLKYCLERNWAEGYSRDNFSSYEEAKAAALLKSRQAMPEVLLKSHAQNGCDVSQQILKEREGDHGH